MTIPTKAPRDPPCNPFLAAALFAQSQNLAFMFSPPIQLNVTCLVLSRTCVSSRFALPGRSVPGALCSRLETGECAKPWFQPFLMPFELLLLMQCSSRQMCLSDAELICLIYPPPLFFLFPTYVEVKNLLDQTGVEIRDGRSIVPHLPRCYISIILCASVLTGSLRSLHAAILVKYGLYTCTHFYFFQLCKYTCVSI